MSNNLALRPRVEIQTAVAGTSVSKPFRVDAAASLNFTARVALGGVSSQPAGTLRLEHTSGDGTWTPVGAEAQETLTYAEAVAGGTAEVFTLTFPAFAGLTQAEGFRVRTQGNSQWAALWFDLDGDGTAPTGDWYTLANSTQPVIVYTGDSAADVAATVYARLVDMGIIISTNWSFTDPGGSSADITFTYIASGGADIDDAESFLEDGLSAGGTTVTIDTDGSGGGSGFPSAAEMTATAHAFATGDRVVVSATTTLPPELSTGEAWVIVVDANTISLAASAADVITGNIVDLSTAEGTFQVVKGDYVFRLNARDDTDVTQLPLWPTCRVVYTGDGEGMTVNSIWARGRA